MEGGLSFSALFHGLGDVRSGQLTAWANTAWYITQVVASLAVLIAEWSKPCDQRLNLWLAVTTVRIVIRLLLSRPVVKFVSSAIERARRAALFPSARQSEAQGEGGAGAPGAVELQAQQPQQEGQRQAQQQRQQPEGEEKEDQDRQRERETALRIARRPASHEEEGSYEAAAATAAAAAAAEEEENAMVVEKVREILDVFSLVWFTLGNAWVFGSRSCSRTSPGIFYLSLSIIIVTYVVLLFPAILAIIVVPFACLCMPCLLSLVIRFRAADAQRRGASRAAINSIPTVKYKADMFGEEDGSAVCPICLGEYAENETLRVLRCSGAHHFHIACIDQWLGLNSVCPCCRENVLPEARAAASAAFSAASSSSSRRRNGDDDMDRIEHFRGPGVTEEIDWSALTLSDEENEEAEEEETAEERAGEEEQEEMGALDALETGTSRGHIPATEQGEQQEQDSASSSFDAAEARSVRRQDLRRRRALFLSSPVLFLRRGRVMPAPPGQQNGEQEGEGEEDVRTVEVVVRGMGARGGGGGRRAGAAAAAAAAVPQAGRGSAD